MPINYTKHLQQKVVQKIERLSKLVEKNSHMPLESSYLYRDAQYHGM